MLNPGTMRKNKTIVLMALKYKIEIEIFTENWITV
jgi:hypothetical protein